MIAVLLHWWPELPPCSHHVDCSHYLCSGHCIFLFFFPHPFFRSDGQDCHLSTMIVQIILITSNLSPQQWISANNAFLLPVLVINNFFLLYFFESINQCGTFALLVQCCRSQRDSATSAETDLKMAVLREAARLRLWLHNKIKEFSALVWVGYQRWWILGY